MSKKKDIKTTTEIVPQAPVAKKQVTAIEAQPMIARSPLNFEWVEFKNELITKPLIEAVREHTEIIHTLLTTRRKLDIQIAQHLSMLRNQFLAYAAQNGLGKTEAEDAFGEYVQNVFNIKSSRASEYIRVANKKSLEGLKLPISSLCELARLEDATLDEFLKGWPPEDIATMTFREIQMLVRDNNENRVHRNSKERLESNTTESFPTHSASKTNASSAQPIQNSIAQDIDEMISGEVETLESPDETDLSNDLTPQDLLILSANLRVAFHELKPAIEKMGLDKTTSDLLTEIIQFFESTSKNGGV